MKELLYRIRKLTRAPRKATKPAVYGVVGWLLGWVYHAWMVLVWWTSRVERVGFEGFERCLENGRGPVVAMYHENVLFAPYVVWRYRPITVASRADWGAMITGVLRHFGYRVIRGGSKGTHARPGSVVKAMEDAVRDEPARPVGLAVDGSQGPVRRVKPGAVALSCRTGAPLFTFHLAVRPALRLRTWDRTKVPLPFSRLLLRIDGPITCDAQTPEAQAKLLQQVQDQLDATLEAAEAALRPGRSEDQPSYPGKSHPA